MRAYVDERYKLVVRQGDSYGELYDLEEDPKEVHNLWGEPDCQQLKYELLLKYVWAELEKESLFMPRIAGA